jgi:hypothetical protein
MSTKYVVHDYLAAIKACECTEETAAFAWLKGFHRYDPNIVTKQLKVSKVFDTWEEAHAELTRRAEHKVNYARYALEQAQAFASNVRGMKPPRGEEVES